MSYLIDTCTLTELTKPKPAPGVDSWFASIPGGASFVSVVTLRELENGIHRLASSRRRSTLERWFSDLRDRFEGQILGVDESIAQALVAPAPELLASPPVIEPIDVLASKLP